MVLVISVVSFPLLLDRNVGVCDRRRDVGCAPCARIPARWRPGADHRRRPGRSATIPLLVGLAIVLPILGHATWHLYRKVVGTELTVIEP